MKRKVLISGLAGAVILVSMSIGAFAASNLEQIQAYLNMGVKINLNGKDWQAKDSDGSNLYPITYNGSTYLPVRAVGEAFGTKIGWDGDTNTVLLGTDGSSTQTSTSTDGQYTAEDFTLSDVTAKKDEFGSWNVVGDVKNTGTKDHTDAMFTITFLDANGKRVGTADGTVLSLKQGETKTVQFTTLDDLTGYKSIKFQVNASM